MSTGIDDHRSRPTAVWFRAARASQKMDDGQPWTVDELIERMVAEVGWAPSRPNYSTYENGHTIPKPPTMAKFYEFWKRYGIDPPDLTPPVTGGGDTLPPVAYLERIDSLVALVGRLVLQNADLMAASGLAPQSAEQRAQLVEWIGQASSSLPLPDGPPVGSTPR